MATLTESVWQSFVIPIWFRLRSHARVISMARDPSLWFVYENALICLILSWEPPMAVSPLDNEAFGRGSTCLLPGGYPECFIPMAFLNYKLAAHIRLVPSLSAECGGFITSSQRVALGNETTCALTKLHSINVFSLKNSLRLSLGRLIIS